MPFLTGDNPGTATTCYQLQIPDDLYFRAAVRGVLLQLTDESNWEQFGTATADEYAALARTMYEGFQNDDCT